MTSMFEQLCQCWYFADNDQKGWLHSAPAWDQLSGVRKAEVRARVLDILRGEVRRSECSEADLSVWNRRTVDLAWFDDFAAPEPLTDDGRLRWFHDYETVSGRRIPVDSQCFTHVQASTYKGRHLRYCYARPDLDSDVLPALEALLRWSIVAVHAEGQSQPRVLSLARLVERPEVIDLRLKKGQACTMQLRFNYPCLTTLEKVLAKRDRERPPWAMSFHVEGVEWW